LAEAARIARARRVRIFVGSGVTAETAGEVAASGLSVIVGSDLRKGGRAGAPLDSARMAKFVKAWNGSAKTRSRKK
jgi:predicted TIM-barrel enzyme